MRTRIISGAVGVLLLSAILYFHDTIVLPIAVAAIIAVMLFELIRAVKLEKNKPILIAAEICGILMPFIYNNFYYIVHYTPDFDEATGSVISLPDGSETRGEMTLLAFAVILMCAFAIFITWLKKHKEIKYEQVFFVLAVMVLVPQAMTTMVRIDRMYPEKQGIFYLVMGLCGAWIADTGAYFSGVALGKHKLCPEISPKKTVEGLVGGILTTAIVYAAAFSIHDGFTVKTAVIAFVAGAVCAVIGTVGDLSASMVKRQIGFKDYGKIMPGHGGLMDRFDSVLFVLPTFYVFLNIMNLF